jgi:hypothetical protein
VIRPNPITEESTAVEANGFVSVRMAGAGYSLLLLHEWRKHPIVGVSLFRLISQELVLLLVGGTDALSINAA